MSKFLQKLLSKAKEKADALVQDPPRTPKERLLDLAKGRSRPDTEGVSDTRLLRSSRSPFSPSATLQSRIHKYLPLMSSHELSLYLYLLDLAFIRSNHSDRIVEYNQREVMKSVGIGSHSTAVRIISSLAKKNLVIWVCKASKRGEKSLLKVMLPPRRSIRKLPRT